MSRDAVDLIEDAVRFADDQMDGYPFANLSDPQVDRRYAEWITEFIYDHGWLLEKAA